MRAFAKYDNVIDKLYDIFIDYVDIPLERVSSYWLSSVLKRNEHYFSDFIYHLTKTKKFEHLRKYIELLVSIYLTEENDLRYPLKKGKSLDDLKIECHKLIFETLKNKKLISDLYNPTSFLYAKRILKGQISMDNHELFDIIINSLVALSKAHRNKHPRDSNYIFPLGELSRELSLSEYPYLLRNKFKKGTPLLRTQARRLIDFLRENFHNNPEELHDVIYEIRRHNARLNKIWYWNKYNIHFEDLYIPQMKAFFDVTLGLNVFGKDFLRDAQESITKSGYIIEGEYSLEQHRHHLELGTAGYLILERYVVNGKYVYQFKLVPLDKESHFGNDFSIHSLKGVFYEDAVDLVNARLLHLYKLTERAQKEGLTIDDFRDSKLNGIWDAIDDDILNKWIERWDYYKENGEKEYYKKFYPKFYEKVYLPFARDFELYKVKDPNCQFPEFWFWYSSNYLGEELLFHDKNNP